MAKSKLKTIKPGKHPLFIKVVKGMLPKGPSAPGCSTTCMFTIRQSIPSRTLTPK